MPTQAEIEAAVRAIFREWRKDEGPNTIYDSPTMLVFQFDGKRVTQIARVAIEAAERVRKRNK